MARKKKYDEAEVVERAMNLFWRNGYVNTSMQMLEKEMGINKFSIYASFENKHGLFLKCLERYKTKVRGILEKLKNANNGVADIKQFFYDSVSSDFKDDHSKGCFITNTYNEFSQIEDQVIKEQVNSFMTELKKLIIEKLKMHKGKDEETIVREANYLLLAKHGLAAASRVNTEKEIEDYIELTFKNI
ncbi:TetR/AcrR family transcriptional regulator [Maribacter sp. MMG018]|uniref:TetR/AcrR family transcriptional regulator n=1 Tax=Maribacter sp. MMG018 TaxID=2822688 RepID=UPI001B36B08B|nr:TetR/AcrR family transcriptional regulator [Maribacter sp. MMG018]MBQ4914234.1 TetR/AcrR family transcriptional regulator [Maribacter sp. MMG018]